MTLDKNLARLRKKQGYRWTPWVFDTSLTPFSGGNYLFLQVKDMFWSTWY